jgi:hypothetical protein
MPKLSGQRSRYKRARKPVAEVAKTSDPREDWNPAVRDKFRYRDSLLKSAHCGTHAQLEERWQFAGVATMIYGSLK